MEPHNIKIVASAGERGIVLIKGGNCDLCENLRGEVLEFDCTDEYPGLSVCLPCLREALAKAGWLARLR